ncbi:MAG: MFS family permease [bacterium]|jgi:MFS family permease
MLSNGMILRFTVIWLAWRHNRSWTHNANLGCDDGVANCRAGLLPDYYSIGIAALILLVVIRLIQGVSVDGEFSSSVTYMVETAPADKRGRAGSWANVECMSGMLLGSVAAAFATTVFAADVLDT